MGLRSTYRRCRVWKKKVIFSDEGYFDLGGYVNKQNCKQANLGHRKPARIHWKADAPETSYCFVQILEMSKVRPLQSIAIVIGPCWTNLFEEEDIGNIRFQQDDVTCHTAETTLDVLRPVFKDRIICRRVDVVWSPGQLRFDTVGLLFVGCRQR